MLFAMMIGMVVAAPIGGRLTDWIGARLSAFAGSLVLMCGSLLLCNLLSYSGSLDVIAPLLLFGVGIGLCSAPSQSAAMSAARPHEAGMAAGASSTMRYLGGICSMLMLSVILGDDATTTEARHQFMTYLFAAAVALSILTGFFLPRRRVVTKL